MTIFSPVLRALSVLIIASFVTATSFAGYAQASTAAVPGMVATETVVNQQSAAADRAQIMNMLDREDVRAQIESLGVDPAEATERLAALSDAEIQQLTQNLEREPAGAGTGATLIGAAVTVFIVLLITDILCLTSVFNFTRCSRG
ncbi:MAG: PA2779 family protein [Sphingomonadales bacterium]